MLRVVPEDDARQEFTLTLDEICRLGAERMLAIALEAEVDAYLERHREARDDRGHALVVRNGSARGRTVVAGAGPSRCARRGWTTAGSMRAPASAAGSRARSCPRTPAAPRRWPRS